MKNSFLYKIANCYAKQDEGNLRNLCFVFPSRRSGLFFTKYLGQCSGKPIFAPRIATIGDLFDELSFYTRTDRIELISILYDNYLKIVSSESFNIDSFDEFVYKAETLLSDFGDIDKYLVDADDLFANITDLESISDSYDYLSLEQRQAIVDFWKITLEGAQSKEGPLKFIQLWKILSPLYHSFKADLDSRGLAYEGMIYRSVAQQIDEQDPHIEEILGQYDRIVFVGHNALCNCEKKLFNYIRNNDMGDFYWDFYGDLLQDNNNKASKFLSSYISDYPSRYAINVINPSYPEIDIVNVPSGIGQAKKVSEYLKLMNSNETAVILPDSTMLMPLLNSIPENVQNINVTMGYGLSNSSFASFMAAANAMQLGKKKRKEAFYHQDVMALLSHTITVTICPTEAKELATTIVNNNLISVPQSILSESESDFLKLLFTPESSVNDLMDWQLNLIDAIAPNLSVIEKEFAYGYYKSVSHIKDLNISHLDKIETYLRFLRQIISSLTVAFKGEPLRGLQIMGPLETRALDFENIIIMSVNEGTFPEKNDKESYIPYNLRRGFDLPTPELFDSISAYHFYRSIYRAKKVVLLYDSRTYGTHIGEQSRFIMQLKHHYTQVNLIDKVCTYTVNPSRLQEASIEKDEAVMAKIRKYLFEDKKPLSASSINEYIDCPLRFYYTRIEGIKESQKIEEQFDAGPFGTTFHEIMKALYEPFTNNIITKDIIYSILKRRQELDTLIKDQMRICLKYNNLPIEGKRLITFEMMKTIVERTLQVDSSYSPFTYIEGEKRVFAELDFDGEKVSMYGIIDRLDMKDSVLRIVDYKTGGAELHKPNESDDIIIEKIFDGDSQQRPYTSLQMIFYAYLLSKQKCQSFSEIEMTIYQIKKMFSKPNVSLLCSEDCIKLFEEQLKYLIREILSEGKFISKPSVRGKCDYCPVRILCKN